MTQYYVHSAFTIDGFHCYYSSHLCQESKHQSLSLPGWDFESMRFVFPSVAPWYPLVWSLGLENNLDRDIQKRLPRQKMLKHLYIYIFRMSHSGSGSNRRSIIHQTTRRSKRQNTIRCAKFCCLYKNGFNFPGELIWCGVVMRLTQRNQGKENTRLCHSSCHSN